MKNIVHSKKSPAIIDSNNLISSQIDYCSQFYMKGTWMLWKELGSSIEVKDRKEVPKLMISSSVSVYDMVLVLFYMICC